jgi:hypothetical protein
MKPEHYKTESRRDVIDFCETWEIGFSYGCCIKYVCRLGKKDEAIKELGKVKDFLNRKWDYSSATNRLLLFNDNFWEDAEVLCKDYKLDEHCKELVMHICRAIAHNGRKEKVSIDSALILLDLMIAEYESN